MQDLSDSDLKEPWQGRPLGFLAFFFAVYDILYHFILGIALIYLNIFN